MQAAQSVYLEHARAAAMAAAAAALAPPPGPPPDPEAEGGADSDSGISWAEQQGGNDADDYAESSPRGACDAACTVFWHCILNVRVCTRQKQTYSCRAVYAELHANDHATSSLERAS